MASAKIKPYSHSELAAMYGIDPRTLKKWLRPIEHVIGKIEDSTIYYNKQVRLIFEHLDAPDVS